MPSSNPPRKSNGKVCLVLLAAALAFLSSCGNKPKQAAPGAVPVTAAMVTEKEVPIQIEAVGNVEAYSTVSVKAMVAGEVVKVYFKEGQDVKKGDLLFTIDPRPFQAKLEKELSNQKKDQALVKQAKANLAKDMAQANNAEREARRYAELIKQGYVSEEQYDQVRTNASALLATVLADQAALQTARDTLGVDKSLVLFAQLNLRYCTLHSPMNGRTGLLLVHEGNLIKANDLPNLVILNQIQPIYVTFAVPEDELNEIKKYMAVGELTVEALPGSQTAKPAIGKINFIDNAVDPNTGTVKLRGIFKNEDKTLWPGQFCSVTLTLGIQRRATVIPSQAVQTGQKGSYVFVIHPDSTVDVRTITLDRIFKNLAVIKEGLSPGEKVVTDGQLRLAPGMRVQIQDSAETAPAGLPSP